MEESYKAWTANTSIKTIKTIFQSKGFPEDMPGKFYYYFHSRKDSEQERSKHSSIALKIKRYPYPKYS